MFHRLICNIKDNIGSSLCIVSFDIRRISNCGNNRSITICMEFFLSLIHICNLIRIYIFTRRSLYILSKPVAKPVDVYKRQL